MGEVDDKIALPRIDRGVSISPVADACRFDIRKGEKFHALPLFHSINDAIIALKRGVLNGERGCSVGKCGAYLGYRVITYLCLPIILNLLSTLISLVLTIITLPTRCCTDKINRWCWTRFQGSFGFTLQSLYDFTADVRQLTGRCCCAPDSSYLAI
jgi:hypothetical protein